MEESKVENNCIISSTTEHESSRLGLCEVCKCTIAKYTCPKCEVKTCSLQCSKIHKQELECSGIRDKTKFIPLRQMTNFDLSSDYRMLEEITRNVAGYKKALTHKFSSANRELPHHLYKLKQQAGVYKTNIKFLPTGFVKRKHNRTLLHFKTNVIYWQIEWVFVNADNLRMVDNRVVETEKLGSVLQKYFAKQDNDVIQERLQYYQACDVTGVRVFLKAEQCAGNKYYEADLNESVRENLRGKTIVEHPTFYVVFKEHAGLFNLVDADESNTQMSSDAIVDNIIKSAEEDDGSYSSLKNLWFASEDSDVELSPEDYEGL